MIEDEGQGNKKEPFFGFLEWISVSAFISGGTVALLSQLEGVVRIIGILAYGIVVLSSGWLLYRSRARGR